MAAVPVVVFSDFTCPFCHVTEAALRRLEDEGLAAPRYAAFELFPAPAPLGTPRRTTSAPRCRWRRSWGSR